MAIFNSYVKLPEGTTHGDDWGSPRLDEVCLAPAPSRLAVAIHPSAAEEIEETIYLSG